MFRILAAFLIVALFPNLSLAEGEIQHQPPDSVGAGVEVIWKWTTGGQSLGQMAVDSKGEVVLSGCHLLEGGNWNILVRKLNKKGELLWSGNYGTDSLSESASRCFVGKDRSIFLYCTHANPINNWPRVRSEFVTKLSSKGDSLWSYKIDTLFLSEVTDVQLIHNDEFLIVGQHNVMDGDSVVLKIPAATVVDRNGRMKWQKSYTYPADRWYESKFEQIVSYDKDRNVLSTLKRRECKWLSYFFREPQIIPMDVNMIEDTPVISTSHNADTSASIKQIPAPVPTPAPSVQYQEPPLDSVNLYFWGYDANNDSVITENKTCREPYLFEIGINGDSLLATRPSTICSPEWSQGWLFVQERPGDPIVAYTDSRTSLLVQISGDGSTILDTLYYEYNNNLGSMSLGRKSQLRPYVSGYLYFPGYSYIDANVSFIPNRHNGFEQRKFILTDIGLHPGNFSYQPQTVIRGKYVYVLTQTRYRDNPGQGYTNAYCLRLKGFK